MHANIPVKKRSRRSSSFERSEAEGEKTPLTRSKREDSGEEVEDFGTRVPPGELMDFSIMVHSRTGAV